jgi:hypothetical protein
LFIIILRSRPSGIYANGNLDINFSWMDTDVANRNGGAATVWTGSLTVVGGAISFNQAGGNGGAFNVNNSVYVDQVVFTSNMAGADGGAILQWNGNDGLSVTIQSSTFDLNKAGSTGGALSVAQGAAATITHSTFKNNQVDTGNSNEPKGGAVFFSDASRGHSLTISDTTFISNSLNCMGCPNYFGGGLYAVTSLTGKVILDQDMFKQNNGWIGGGVYADKALITRSTFQGNTGGSGAAVYLTGASQVKGSAFYQNSGTNGGSGLSVTSAATSLSVEDAKFIGNSSVFADLGGAMILGAQTITMKNVAVVDTQVPQDGSAILFNDEGSSITLYHVTVNDTHLAGGARTKVIGIHVKGPTVVNIFNSMLTNHGTGVKVETGSACSLYNTLWYGSATDIDGTFGSYANYYPVYSDPAYAVDRYHLTPASGAIDQGVDRMVYTDLDGDLRDSQPDLGADEYRAHVYLPLVVR